MKIALNLLAGGLVLLGAGCASVGKEWKMAATQPPPTNDISGAWQGTWTSLGSGHTGRLRCLMTKKSDAEYEARFHATFWKIFSSRYTVPLHATQHAPDDYRLEGTANIGGLMGGDYHYQGVASPTHFTATYSSEKDHGTFDMKRVEP